MCSIFFFFEIKCLTFELFINLVQNKKKRVQKTERIIFSTRKHLLISTHLFLTLDKEFSFFSLVCLFVFFFS